MNLLRSSRLNLYYFVELVPMAIMISSKSGIPLSIISVCPRVNGSKDPGKTAVFFMWFVVKWA